MPETISRWRLIGATTGLSAVVAHALLIAVPLPNQLAAVIASIFGPLVGCASVALYRVLAWQRGTIPGLLAAIANVAAGALVVAMFLVQIALNVAEEQAPGLDASTERILVYPLRARSFVGHIHLSGNVSLRSRHGAASRLWSRCRRRRHGHSRRSVRSELRDVSRASQPERGRPGTAPRSLVRGGFGAPPSAIRHPHPRKAN